MNNPADGVPDQLLPHVHLVCNHKYAFLPQPNMDLVVRYLLEAPRLVRDITTMSWMTWLDPPRDGTVFLAWQPPKLTTRFASDGYLWADPERVFTQQMKGFNLEMYVHSVGLRPGLDSVATHSRRRYRLVPTAEQNPSQPMVDPQLWLVQYHQSDPANHRPAQSIPLSDAMRQNLTERSNLQNAGQLQLQHKEFMLRDRENWPTINPPSNSGVRHPSHTLSYPNNVMAQVSRAQNAQGPMSQAVPGPSPSKRPRHSSTSYGQSVPAPLLPHSSALDLPFEEGENATGTDFLDVLTPQEISLQRYTQHHEWLEEILNSPFDTRRIVPGELGLGRAGELEALTRDFFATQTRANHPNHLHPPRLPEKEDYEKSRPVVEDVRAPRVGRLEDGKAEAFSKQAADYIAKLQSEMKTMAEQQTIKMAKLNRIRSWTELEHGVRTDTLELLSEDAKNPEKDGGNMVAISNEAEKRTQRKIRPVNGLCCIEKGGLEETEPALLAMKESLAVPPTELESLASDNMLAVGELANNTEDNDVSQAQHEGAATAAATDQNPVESGTEVQASNDAVPSDWIMVEKAPEPDDGAKPSLDPTSAMEKATGGETAPVTEPPQGQQTSMDVDNNGNLDPTELQTGDQTEERLVAGANEFDEGIDFGDLDTAGEAMAGFDDLQEMGNGDDMKAQEEQTEAGQAP